MQKLLTLLIIAFISFGLQAQVKSGEITYKIKMKGLPADQADMLGDLGMTTIFNKKFVKTELNMGIAKTTTIQNAKTQTTVVLMNMMGKKIRLETTAEEAEKLAKEMATNTSVRETDVITNIAGYDCKKSVVTVDGNDVIVYTTNEIKVPAVKNVNSSGLDFTMINGSPLMFTAEQGGISMEFKAVKIEKKKVKKSNFTIPSGYEKMNLEQFKNMTQGMGM